MGDEYIRSFSKETRSGNEGVYEMRLNKNAGIVTEANWYRSRPLVLTAAASFEPFFPHYLALAGSLNPDGLTIMLGRHGKGHSGTAGDSIDRESRSIKS